MTDKPQTVGGWGYAACPAHHAAFGTAMGVHTKRQEWDMADACPDCSTWGDSDELAMAAERDRLAADLSNFWDSEHERLTVEGGWTRVYDVRDTGYLDGIEAALNRVTNAAEA